MMNKKVLIIAVISLAFIGLAAWQWPAAFTVVSIEEVEQLRLSEEFDPVTYVDEIWESRIMPAILDNAVDLNLVLNEIQTDDRGFVLKGDLIDIANTYGLITVGEAHVYKVKGQGQVISVDTESRIPRFEILVEGYNGPIRANIYLGPRLPSDDSSIRDSVGFISFGDFREQTEYGKVGAEMNKRVIRDVLSSLEPESLMGKTVSFYGAFTIRTFNLIEIDLNEISIVPVTLELAP